MIAALLLGLRLSWPSAGAARVRTAMVVGAAAAGAIVMIGALAISHAERVLHPGVYDDPDMRRVLLGTVLAVALPVLALLSVAAKLSAQLRERRLANLRLLGLSPALTRVVAVTEVAVSALVGAAIGVLLFEALRPVIAQVSVAGRTWSVESLTPTLAGYVAVVVAVPAAVTVVAALPRKSDLSGTLAVSHAGSAARPSWSRAIPLIAGIGLCLYVVIGAGGAVNTNRSASGAVNTNRFIGPLFAGVGLLGIGLVLLVPVLVRAIADALLSMSRRPTLVIAGRRLQSQPSAVNRVISGLLIGLFLVTGARGVVAAFESTPQYVAAAAQINDRQLVAMQAPEHRADAAVARAHSVAGVTGVVAFPMLESVCVRSSFCPVAIVASCAQLRAVAPDVRGCIDGRPSWAVPPSDFGASTPPGAEIAARSSYRWKPYLTTRGSTRDPVESVPAPAPRNQITGVDDVLNLIGANVVLPPGLPGIAALAGTSTVSILVTASAGRDLSEKLRAEGLFAYSAGDFADYDLTAQLRALVWVVAGVILATGLLALAIGAIDRAVARRREVLSLQLIGVGRSVLRLTQLVEAAVPLVLGCLLSVACGLLACASYLAFGGPGGATPWHASVVLAMVATVGSGVVAGLTVIASSPRIKPDLIRSE